MFIHAPPAPLGVPTRRQDPGKTGLQDSDSHRCPLWGVGHEGDPPSFLPSRSVPDELLSPRDAPAVSPDFSWLTQMAALGNCKTLQSLQNHFIPFLNPGPSSTVSAPVWLPEV